MSASRKKKIIIVDNSTWNIYNFRLNLIRRLKANGYRVVVVAPVDQYIHYINESYFTKHIPIRHLSAQAKNPFRDFLFLWELYAIYRKEEPHLIVHFTVKPNIYGSLAARLAGIPAISTITGLGYSFLHNGFTRWLVPQLYRRAFKQVRKVIFYNQDDRHLLVENGIVAAEKALLVPGSGVNTNHFRPLSLPDEDRFVFLFVGRLLYDKGLAEYVAAARQLRAISRKIECWVIGELSAQNPAAVPKEQMLQWMEEKQIRYFGTAQDVRPFLKQADVMVLPSYREGVPRSVLEAMAMEKPIITTHAPGCKETTRHGENGYLVPSRDADALAESMLAMYQLDEDRLREMGRRSRQRVLQLFDEKIVTKRFVEIIKTELPGHKREKHISLEPVQSKPA